MKTLQSSPYPKKEFLINVLTSQGGGGHYAMYNALRAVVEQQQLPWRFTVTDIDEIADNLANQKKIVSAYKLLGFSGHDLYNLMLKSGWTWLWPLKMRLNKLLVKLNHDVGVKFFAEYWREQQPDLVVSVVPLYNKGLWESVQQAKPGTPVVTIIGDYADFPPAFWIEPKTGNYLVCGTEKTVEQARFMGVKEELIIKTSGTIVHPRFYEPIVCDRRAERQRLGLDPDCLTGLVLFGAYGSKVMLEIAERLERFQQKLQLIFICGRNEELATALRESQGLQKRFVTAFTKDIPYYMHLSDFLINKPGACSISEALVMNLPMIMERNISTLIHERYNADCVEQKEVGLVVRNFRNIDQAVKKFLQPENFARYRANVAAVNNRAVFEISDNLQKILANSYKTTETASLEYR
ncbi:processive diacylglycerol beta-glucosyltransferase [Nostoc sp. NIES-4103]|nr:processive diacylglycerol beta-glucosyltransferase [Nostoc sp. NIES-4103]